MSVISLSEIVGRNLGYDSFLSRLRPSEYKTVPEPVLNATLKDIHDFIQYSAIQVQRIMFGEDLGKAFAVRCYLRCEQNFRLMTI